MTSDVGILIPVLRPEERIEDLVRSLVSRGSGRIVLVVDGSGEDLVRFAEALGQEDSVTVLRHFVPRGRGSAIRTGVNHFGVEEPKVPGIVIVDPGEISQPEDIEAVARAVLENPESLAIGVRKDGVGEGGPLQSLAHRWVGRLLLRRMIRGMPAGLRGVPTRFFPSLLTLTSSGPEFDLDMLIESSLRGVPFVEVPVSAGEFPASGRRRYQPFVESLRTIFVFPRFIVTSVLTAAIDLVVFTLVYLTSGNILFSMAAARLLAGTFNYLACRSFVFRSRKSVAETLAEYVLLVTGLGTISYAVVTAGAVVLGANVFLMKIAVEAVLFVGNFAIQQGLIFPRPERVAADSITDWEGYYDRPFPASRISRRITGRLLSRFFALSGREEGDLDVTEFGGADSCFYGTLRERFKVSKYRIVDTSRAGLDMFRERHPNDVAEGTVELYGEDVRKAGGELAGKSDICFSVGLIEHFRPEELNDVVRSHFEPVKDGGLVIISFPVPTWLYMGARRVAERFGLWKFPDETPLQRERVRSILEKHGTVLREKTLWPILFTQCMMAVRKERRAEAAVEAPADAATAAREGEPEAAKPEASGMRHPSAPGTFLRGAAIIAGTVLAGVGVCYLPEIKRISWPFWITVGGGFLAGLGLAGTPARRDDEPADTPTGEPRPWLGLALFVLGFVLAALGSSILATDWNTFFRVLPIWFVGLPLMAAGLNRFQGYPSFLTRLRTRSILPGWTTREILCLLAITVFAAFLRTHRLDYFPPPDGIMALEEPHVGGRALQYFEQGHLKWELLLGNVLTIASFKVFGMSYFSLRFPAIALSILTIPFFYLLMRELVGLRARMAATLLFAVASWHLIHARVAHGIMTPVAVSVLFLYFLIRTRTRPRLSSYVWVGATIAILMAAYAPFRVAGVITILFYLAIGVKAVILRVARRAGVWAAGSVTARRRAHPLGLLLTFVVAAELFFPIWAEISRFRASFYFEAWNRSSRIARGEPAGPEETAWQQLAGRLGTIWGIFHIEGESGHWGIRRTGKLDPVTGTMFVLALGYLAIAWYRGFNGFFLLLFLAIFHGLLLLSLSIDLRRLTGLVPILFVLIGLWLGALETWFSQRMPRGSFLLTALLVAAGAGAAVLNWDLYFRRYITAPETRQPFVTYQGMMAGILSRSEPGKPVIVFSRQTFTLGKRISDFLWLIPKELETYGARDWDELYEVLHKAGPGKEVVLLIQGPGNLDEMEEHLRAIFHCGPFERIEHPDNFRVQVRRQEIVVPPDLPTVNDSGDEAKN